MAYHAMKWRGGWAVWASGGQNPIFSGLKKPGAWREARRLARGEETRAYLHDKDGRIRVRNDFSKGSAHE